MVSHDDRYEVKSCYWQFLVEAWQGIAPLLRKDARFVCRLGAKGMEAEEITTGLIESITKVFPKARLCGEPMITLLRNRQTDCFRPGSKGCLFEIDHTFALSIA